MQSLANQLIHFYETLAPPALPKGIELLRPQTDKKIMTIVKKFFKTYYGDNKSRKLILGINPGRFGAGITGINFTAPRQLKENCHIDHPFGNSSELSAEFIYEMIEQYGGVKKFYEDYFIGAMSPLGFVRDGKNINYYDDKKLLAVLTPFITDTIQRQLQMGFKRDIVYCIGGEKNFNFLSGLNEKHHFFEKIIALPHPRFIMQYRRKKKQEYIKLYLDRLTNY
ncbi:uracil-DNA glycosylase family protein [Terrimonas alba]|uniref:uracil-DNA glycosylase family protein n=1 Tax=Terrimonas alba TaxID=3349636 RepID=UPI0035F372D9